ncbi:U4/U6 small nuclear ribonucleoprotein PRP4-like protein isoform X2 [Cryptomeria japonica]|uniref:U4/U6 small nuclear ribonucleoprotein PRP4-like protein isoform X2 n=1 Tax=Cryptomeria japonica TaxID=3369 RepID=UPI0027DAABE7|nr:U4/U6 small nuclear ribonucleoprotein PRP4-like protein isoform X2 [Cryptomeria japonica]
MDEPSTSAGLDPSTPAISPMDITIPPAAPLISTEANSLTSAPVATVSSGIPPAAIVPPFIPPNAIASTSIIPPPPPPPVMPLAPLPAVPAVVAPNFPSSPLDNNSFSSSISVSPQVGVPPVAPAPVIIPRPPFVPPVPPSSSRPGAPPSFVLPARPLDSNDEQGPDSDSKDESPSSSPEHPDDSSAADYEITEEIRKVRERQDQLVQELLMRRRAYALAVPTNDSAVRARLRRLNEPVTLFGEREMERRDRLRTLMAKLDSEGQLEKLMKVQEEEEAAANAAAEDVQDMEGPQSYPFYTIGSQELLKARTEIMKFSLPRAASRIQRAKRRREDPDEDEDAELNCVLEQASRIIMDCSEIGDDRPLSGCAFSSDATMLATSAWSGVTKLWRVPEIKKVVALKGHTERVTDVAFSPRNNHLATSSADRTAILWNPEGGILKTFEGHLDRLARVAFHPSGLYLGTTSFDKTWRLWDLNTGIELLLQEGHSRSVYGIAFHCDGSLVATCGLDALARVWDLRTGRSILALEGHVKPVLGIDFSPNGYHLATGGEDHTCRIWDIRKRRSIYVIPAHSHLISQVKFEPQEGYFLVTASYDNTAKMGNTLQRYLMIEQ